MLNIGFIGTGGMGRYQCAAFDKVRSVKVFAGADPAAASRKAFAKAHPDARVYRDHRDLLADTDVDAVVVASPTGYHKSLVIDVLRSGRPAMTEKPMALSVADCHRMLDAAGKTRQKLMVAHCRRFDPQWGTMAKAIASGVIGQPVLWRAVAAHVFRVAPWFMDEKLGGGPMIDGLVHNYDFANLMFGEPQYVQASAIKLSRHSATDTATAIVHYARGCQLLASWSWSVPGKSSFDLLGPRGCLTEGAGELTPPKSDGDRYGYWCHTNLTGKQRLLKFRKDGKDMYQAQAEHFRDYVTGKQKRCIASGEQSLKAVAVAEAILKAGKSGRSRQVKW